MKKNLTFLFAILCSAFLSAAPEAMQEKTAEASQNDAFRVFVGGGLRNFRRPKMNTAATPSFTDYYKVGTADGDILLPQTNENYATALEASEQNPVAPVVPLKFASYTGDVTTGLGRYTNREEMNLTAGFSYQCWEKDNSAIDFVFSFQNASLNSKISSFNCGSASAYTKRVINSGSHAASDIRLKESDYAVANASQTRFDLDLQVFDAGLSYGYAFDCGLSTYVSAGLTLSIANMDSESTASTSLGGGNQLTVRDTDDETEINWGYYVAAGISYGITDKIAVSLEARYDQGFGDVGTRYATQSLDTFGAMLKLSYGF